MGLWLALSGRIRTWLAVAGGVVLAGVEDHATEGRADRLSLGRSRAGLGADAGDEGRKPLADVTHVRIGRLAVVHQQDNLHRVGRRHDVQDLAGSCAAHGEREHDHQHHLADGPRRIAPSVGLLHEQARN